MAKSVAILYFTDGLEAEASLRSARDIQSTLGATSRLLSLTRHNWIKKLGDLDPDTICFLASHGDIGENGTIQHFLESKGITHTHSNATTSSILTDKHMTKLIYTALNIPTPGWMMYSASFGTSMAKAGFLEKPRFGGSKRGIRPLEEGSVENYNPDVLHEEIIDGELEISIVVLRDHDSHTALPPIIRKRSTNALGELQEVEGDVLDLSIVEYCQNQAVKLSTALDCYGVTKTDFVINRNGEALAIETDAIPGLSRTNAASLAAAKADITYNQLLERIMETTQ